MQYLLYPYFQKYYYLLCQMFFSVYEHTNDSQFLCNKDLISSFSLIKVKLVHLICPNHIDYHLKDCFLRENFLPFFQRICQLFWKGLTTVISNST